jgi:hypothetical protein
MEKNILMKYGFLKMARNVLMKYGSLHMRGIFS